MKYKKQIVLAVLTIAGVLTLTPGVYVANAPDFKEHLAAQITATAPPFQLKGPTQVRQGDVHRFDFVTNLAQNSGTPLDVEVKTSGGSMITGFLPHPRFKCEEKLTARTSTSRVVTLLANAEGHCAGSVSIDFSVPSLTANQTVEIRAGGNVLKKEITLHPYTGVRKTEKPDGFGDATLEVEKSFSGFRVSCIDTGNPKQGLDMGYLYVFDPVKVSQDLNRTVYDFSGLGPNANIFCTRGGGYINNAWGGQIQLPYSVKRSWRVSIIIPQPVSPNNGITEGNECEQNSASTPDCDYTRIVLPLPPYCGDKIVNHQEEHCDDGNNDDTDICKNSCIFNDNAAKKLLSLSFEKEDTSQVEDNLPEKNHGDYTKKKSDSTYQASPVTLFDSDHIAGKALSFSTNYVWFDRDKVKLDLNDKILTFTFFANPKNGGVIFSKQYFSGQSNALNDDLGWNIALRPSQLIITAQSGKKQNPWDPDQQERTTLSVNGNFSGWHFFTIIMNPFSNADFKKGTKVYLDSNPTPLTLTANDIKGGFQGKTIAPYASFLIGARGSFLYDSFYEGELDEVQIFEGGLSPTGIAQLLQSFPPPPNLNTELKPHVLLYLPFNDGNASPLVKDYLSEVVGIQRKGNTGTRMQQTLVNSVENKFGKALFLDSWKTGEIEQGTYEERTGPIIDLGQGFDLDGGSATIAFWTKLSTISKGQSIVLFSKKNVHSGFKIIYYDNAGSKTIEVVTQAVSGIQIISSSISAVLPKDISNTWAHLAIIIKTQSEAQFKNSQLFLDGEGPIPLTNNQATPVFQTASFAPLEIGTKSTYTDFTVFLDEFFIFNRALSKKEITFIKDGHLALPTDTTATKSNISVMKKPKPSVLPISYEWNWGK